MVIGLNKIGKKGARIETVRIQRFLPKRGEKIIFVYTV